MKNRICDLRWDDEIHLTSTQPEQLAGDQAQPSTSPATPPEPTVNVPFLLAIAKEETLVWRQHLAGLVALWDAMGVMGLACAKQERVTEFLGRLHELKSILRG